MMCLGMAQGDYETTKIIFGHMKQIWFKGPVVMLNFSSESTVAR